MTWLRKLNPQNKRTVVRAKMFVFDEDFVADTDYAEFLTLIESSDKMKIIEESENWDQTGILTKIIAYEEEMGDGY